ncbi:hypothetical protein V865_003506 [Kwoniella europaea PYCC6329]|uniref:WH1 domain-containing protein n=1 Tax=Kwoniella europaea PYCC6329 TaxID=1423913 RepID=A0AAX4KHD4_9TREE
MMTIPRLSPVSSKGKVKWEAINENITITVITRSSSNVEVHLIHQGRFIIKQIFERLSYMKSPVRKIIHSDASMIFRYEPPQTPVISGMKMKECYQWKFVSNEDCRSFIQLMSGFFEISEHKSQSPIKGNFVEPSQIIPSPPPKVSNLDNMPMASPTKPSPPKSSSSQSQHTPSPHKRTKTQPQREEGTKQGVEPVPTSIPPTNSSQIVELAAENTPSPPIDEATERLKKTLLEDFKLPPTPSDSQCLQQEHPTALRSEGKSTQVDTPPSVYADRKVIIDQSAGNGLNQSESQSTSRPKPGPSCGSSSSSPRDGIHASVNNCLGTPTKSQPLIDFSSQSLDHPTHHSQVSLPNRAKDVSNSEHMSVDGEGHFSNIAIDNYPVLLIEEELEAQRLRKGKRKREEVEDDLEEEDADAVADWHQKPRRDTSPHYSPNTSKPLPKLPYGRGIYDLAPHDLENLVDQAMMESGFEKLVETIGHLIQRRLEHETPHYHPSQLREYNQETDQSNRVQSPCDDRTFQPHPLPSQSAPNDRHNGWNIADPVPPIYNPSPNPFHNSHSQYRSYHSGSSSSHSQYYSLSQDFSQQVVHHTYDPSIIAADTNHISQYTVTPKYSPSVKAHSQHNHLQYTHSYPEQRRSQAGNLNQLLQHSHIYSSPTVENTDYAQYTQPGQSFPEYDYDNEQPEVHLPPSKQSLGFILNDVKTFSSNHTQTESQAERPNQSSGSCSDGQTYEVKKTKLDEEDEELANISREFDNGSSSGSSNAVSDDEEEKEYDYDAMADEDLELEKEIENEV